MRFAVVRKAAFDVLPFVASAFLVGLFAIAVLAGISVVEQRDEFRRQSEAVQELLERQDEAEALRAERLAESLEKARTVLREEAVTHDEAAKADHEALLSDIARLFQRPDPVTSQGTESPQIAQDPVSGPPATVAPSPTPEPATPTTAPSCKRNPNKPKC